MLLFDSVWIHTENTEMKEKGKPFIIRFLIIVIFALMIPLGYLLCLTMSNEEWEYLYGGKT